MESIQLTETVPCRNQKPGRYRRKGYAARDVIQEFLRNYWTEIDGNSLTLRNGILYSYRTPIARWVRRYDEEGHAPFVLVTAYQHSVTTASKHLSPLKRELGRLAAFGGLWWLRVDDPMADYRNAHEANAAFLELEAERLAAASDKGPHVGRPDKRQAALGKFQESLEYREKTGLGGGIDPETPAAIMSEWISEHRAALRTLAAAVRKLCPITGGAA